MRVSAARSVHPECNQLPAQVLHDLTPRCAKPIASTRRSKACSLQETTERFTRSTTTRINKIKALGIGGSATPETHPHGLPRLLGAECQCRTACTAGTRRSTPAESGNRVSADLPAVTLTGYPQWLWIDPSAWHTVTASASLNGLTATVTAQPAWVVWDSVGTIERRLRSAISPAPVPGRLCLQMPITTLD